jgi:Bacterial capsule synthesis protein PGA_cap
MSRVTRRTPAQLPTSFWIGVVGLAVLLVGGAWGGPAAWHAIVTQTAAGPATSDPSSAKKTPTPTPTPDAEFTIVAAGDVLPHLPVLKSARGSDGSYSFAPLLAPLDPWIQGADLALCHLEVPVTPPGAAISGFPTFAAPPAIVDALAAQGWDGCSTASNHSVDAGFAGVDTTLAALDRAGLGHVGTARSATEAAQPQLYRLERAGQKITVAHLATTYATNGMPVDKDKPWSVNLLDAPTLVAQAVAARAAGADLVVASVHCCTEYQTEPTPEQVKYDQALADSGAIDVVLGHHAHVPQPVAKLAGGPRGEGMWVFYGLGNYLSNQDSACCSPKTDSGLLGTVHIRKPPGGPASVTGVEWTGVTVDRLGKHHVHALPEIAAGTGTLSAADVAARAARVAAAAGTQAPQRLTPLTSTAPPPTVVARTS